MNESGYGHDYNTDLVTIALSISAITPKSTGTGTCITTNIVVLVHYYLGVVLVLLHA